MENNLEEKLGAILSDPNMMQQIQALAQSLGQSNPQQPQKEPEKPEMPAQFPTLSRLSSLAGGAAIDSNQKALLSALSPYLSRDRVNRLENAMRAAKMARLASAFLNSGGLQMLTGR